MASLTQDKVEYLVSFGHRFNETVMVWEILGIILDPRISIELTDTEYKIVTSKKVMKNTNRNFLKKAEYKLSDGFREIKPGEIFVATNKKNKCFCYIVDESTVKFLCNELGEPGSHKNESIMHWEDTFVLKPGMIENYSGQPAITSVGRYLLNKVALVAPFGSTIPYINDLWNPESLESTVANYLIEDKVNVDQVIKFIDKCYYLISFSSLCVVTATEKSFTTDPAIVERKKELVKQYRGQLDDPLVSSKIEAELVALDKAYVKGDKCSRYYDAMGKKSYELHRKTMFLTTGTLGTFAEGEQAYTFIVNSLAEGWNPADFAKICNESRRGSYNRGKQTQLGGALAKLIQRVFQNIEIAEDDCGTKRFVEVTIGEKDTRKYFGRTIFVGTKQVVLNLSNVKDYIGKTVKMRSPLTCESKHLCYACTGQFFKQIDQKGIGIIATQIATTFVNQSMKSMHGSTVDIKDIDFTKYLAKS